MFRRDLRRTIAYPPTLNPNPFMTALILWALALYALPLLLLIHYLLHVPAGREEWFRALPRWDRLNLDLALGALLLFGLLVVIASLMNLYLSQQGESESETLETFVGLSDRTGLGGWDRRLLFVPPILAGLMGLLGWAGVPEFLLMGMIALGVGLGSRLLPRFQKEAEPSLLPYSDEELKQLFAQEPGGNVVTIAYRWRFREHPYLSHSPEREFQFTLPFDHSHYQAALQKPHEVHSDYNYARFVREDLTTQEVVMVAAKLKEIHEREGYTPFQQACNVLAFTAQFRYAYDEETKGVSEYPRYPVEMLWDREGDCECHAILAATLMTLLGLDAVLLVIDFAQGPGHVAVGVAGAEEMPSDLTFYEYGGKRYFYCEATPPSGATTAESEQWGWSIGVMPFEDPTRVTLVPLAVEVSPA